MEEFLPFQKVSIGHYKNVLALIYLLHEYVDKIYINVPRVGAVT